MMFQIVPYRKAHSETLIEQGINSDVKAVYQGGFAELAEKQPGSTTIMVGGEPMACGGVIPVWAGRGVVWTIFNENSKECFVPVFRGIATFLREQLKVYRRLEISVPVGFALGHRRAKLLGFKVECPLAKAFLPDGTDCVLYSMVRE